MILVPVLITIFFNLLQFCPLKKLSNICNEAYKYLIAV